jgi:hypothetical protein
MAASSVSRQHLHELVDQLNEQQIPQAAHALEAIHDASLEAILRGIPGLRMPDHWPPQFMEFEPLPVTGEELPSEQLIRERR